MAALRRRVGLARRLRSLNKFCRSLELAECAKYYQHMSDWGFSHFISMLLYFFGLIGLIF